MAKQFALETISIRRALPSQPTLPKPDTKQTAASPVVRRRKYCHQSPLSKELVSVLNDLVGAAHEVQVVLLQKLCHCVTSEGIRYASVVLSLLSEKSWGERSGTMSPGTQ
jgi:hypothetical protein